MRRIKSLCEPATALCPGVQILVPHIQTHTLRPLHDLGANMCTLKCAGYTGGERHWSLGPGAVTRGGVVRGKDQP